MIPDYYVNLEKYVFPYLNQLELREWDPIYFKELKHFERFQNLYTLKISTMNIDNQII